MSAITDNTACRSSERNVHATDDINFSIIFLIEGVSSRRR
jgi:hypothetical protein